MPARLILNADDFGLTPGINRAIAELHQAGVLTSATLMATGPAFDDAVRLARALPTLGVGCHITLVDGLPASLPASIPTLLGPDRRRFRSSLAAFVRDLLLERTDPEEIGREACAQIERLQSASIAPTHLDTHKHTHLFPAVHRPLLKAARNYSVLAVRKPFEPSWSSTASPGARLLRRVQLRILRRYEQEFRPDGIRTTDGTIGIAATGSLSAETLAGLLQALPNEGTYELCCHPGYRDDALDAQTTRLRQSRELEREALLSKIPRMLSLPNAPTLIHYGNL